MNEEAVLKEKNFNNKLKKFTKRLITVVLFLWVIVIFAWLIVRPGTPGSMPFVILFFFSGLLFVVTFIALFIALVVFIRTFSVDINIAAVEDVSKKNQERRAVDSDVAIPGVGSEKTLPEDLVNVLEILTEPFGEI